MSADLSAHQRELAYYFNFTTDNLQLNKNGNLSSDQASMLNDLDRQLSRRDGLLGMSFLRSNQDIQKLPLKSIIGQPSIGAGYGGKFFVVSYVSKVCVKGVTFQSIYDDAIPLRQDVVYRFIYIDLFFRHIVSVEALHLSDVEIDFQSVLTNFELNNHE